MSVHPPPCRVLQLHFASVPGWMDGRSCVQRSNGSNDSNSGDVMALTVIRLQNISSRRGNGSISLAINTETAADSSIFIIITSGPSVTDVHRFVSACDHYIRYNHALVIDTILMHRFLYDKFFAGCIMLRGFVDRPV